MVAFPDDRGGREQSKKKKKKKTGFKVDRYTQYLDTVRGKKRKASERTASTRRVKEIKFDANARKEYLLTLHKEKNRRKVVAFVDRRNKVAKENSKLRQEQRENARLQYNSFAIAPIAPDFTFELPAQEQPAPVNETTEAPPSQFGESVTVVVQRGAPQRVKNPGVDFSDLPPSVAETLEELKNQTRGPAKTKSRLHMVKELQKMKHIRKHSRKGHGKKRSYGKKKNR